MSNPSRGADRLGLALLALLAVAGARPTASSPLQVKLDPEASTVRFLLGATAHEVHGSLPLLSGSLTLNPATGAVSGVVVIDPGHAASGNQRRDRVMRDKVLEAGLFPEIRFRAEKLEGRLTPSAASEVRLVGVVSLHGAEHPLSLPARVELADGRLRARATFRIPYVAWGLHDPSKLFLRVAKEVEVTIEVAGTLTEVAGGS